MALVLNKDKFEFAYSTSNSIKASTLHSGICAVDRRSWRTEGHINDENIGLHVVCTSTYGPCNSSNSSQRYTGQHLKKPKGSDKKRLLHKTLGN